MAVLGEGVWRHISLVRVVWVQTLWLLSKIWVVKLLIVCFWLIRYLAIINVWLGKWIIPGLKTQFLAACLNLFSLIQLLLLGDLIGVSYLLLSCKLAHFWVHVWRKFRAVHKSHGFMVLGRNCSSFKHAIFPIFWSWLSTSFWLACAIWNVMICWSLICVFLAYLSCRDLVIYFLPERLSFWSGKQLRLVWVLMSDLLLAGWLLQLRLSASSLFCGIFDLQKLTWSTILEIFILSKICCLVFRVGLIFLKINFFYFPRIQHLLRHFHFIVIKLIIIFFISNRTLLILSSFFFWLRLRPIVFFFVFHSNFWQLFLDVDGLFGLSVGRFGISLSFFLNFRLRRGCNFLLLFSIRGFSIISLG